MSTLDDPGARAALDPQGMSRLIASFHEQLREAGELADAIAFELPRRVQKVVVAGLGGSAIGADVARSALGEALDVPMVVCRDYALPRFVDRSTLVVASSYSGNTEETLGAFEQAGRARATIVCITSGGELARRARAGGGAVVTIPGGLPPRAAIGYSAISLLGVLRALGVIPSQRTALDETIALVRELSTRYGVEVAEQGNRAKRLARSLYGKIVAVYGSAAVLGAAAVRWRGQMEENAKNLAFHHLLPEMNHNELVGWDFPSEVLRGVGVVFLRDRGDHAQVMRRFDLTRSAVAARAGAVEEVWTEGTSLLARIFSAIHLGDYVSLYLAYLNSVDPTPVRAIEVLKEQLAQ